MFVMYNSANERLKQNIYGHLIGLFFTVILDFLLIPSYGIVGASIASVIAYTAACVYLIYGVLSHIKKPAYQALLLTKDDARFIIAKIKYHLQK